MDVTHTVHFIQSVISCKQISNKRFPFCPFHIDGEGIHYSHFNNLSRYKNTQQTQVSQTTSGQLHFHEDKQVQFFLHCKLAMV